MTDEADIERSYAEIFSGSLGPKLRLKKPIPVKVRSRTIVSCEGVFGEGESIFGESMEGLGQKIRELWDLLQRQELGPDSVRLREKLEEYIEPCQ